MKSERLKIIFMGTPEFGASILEGLITHKARYIGPKPAINGGYEPILVVTAPDKAVGRNQTVTPPPAKVVAQKYNIPVAQPEKIRNLELEIKNLNPDLIIISAYREIIPKEILDIPKYGSLNVHPSLLPLYRGPSPIQAAILNGERKTGVTIILMDEKIDRGPILTQRSLMIEEAETAKTLAEKLANLGTSLLLETIPKRLKDLIKPVPQDESKVTFTKVLTRDDGKIIWKKTAEELEREIRAYFPWPGSYTIWSKTGKLLKIKILKARVFKFAGGIAYPVGKTLIAPQNEICVQCGRGFFPGGGDFLVIERLQLEGKGEMFPEEFLRGHLDFIGTILK